MFEREPSDTFLIFFATARGTKNVNVSGRQILLLGTSVLRIPQSEKIPRIFGLRKPSNEGIKDLRGLRAVPNRL